MLTKTRTPRTSRTKKPKDRKLNYSIARKRLTITEATSKGNTKTDTYDVQVFRDEQGELLGVRLAKRGFVGGPDAGDGVSDVEWAEGTCCCRGNLRWGRCRHVDAVRKLVEVGLVPRVLGAE